jgi:hypothetical protein
MDSLSPQRSPQPEPQVNAQMEDLIRRIGDLCDARAPLSPNRAPLFRKQRPVLGIRCPRCNKRALRRAKTVTALERLAMLVLFRPYCCRYCRYFEMRFLLEDHPISKLLQSGSRT